MKTERILSLTSLTCSIAGYFILFHYYDWKLAIAVFLISVGIIINRK